MITKISRTLVRMAFVAVSLASQAQAADTAAFEAFGGKPGLDRVADLGIERVLRDPRIKDRFTSANIPRLKMMLATQFCMLLGGPCEYTGRNMKESHAGFGLKDADFNALAEDFQLAMDDAGVPFRYQNVLIARLAPMERDIVERR